MEWDFRFVNMPSGNGTDVCRGGKRGLVRASSGE